MSTISFKGREYKINDLLPEVIGLAQELAENARLDQPLPSGTDFIDEEQQKVQTQVRPDFHFLIKCYLNTMQIPAMLILPETIVDAFWCAFAAHHLQSLASALRSLEPTTQPKATATYIQILSLLPDPKHNPYFREFLLQIRNDFPSVVARIFVQGVAFKRPSGPGHICTLIIHLLFWCDTNLGDDKAASIDADVRTAVLAKINALKASPHFNRLEELQRVDIERLARILGSVNSEQMPGNTYLASTRQYLEGQVDCCGNGDCDDSEEADMQCSKCKSVKYCGRKCQQQDWKKGHKLRCFSVRS
jgi:hypothetical protein